MSESVNSPGDETAPFQYGGMIYFTADYRLHLDSEPIKRMFSTNGSRPKLLKINPKDFDSDASDLTLSSDAKRMFYSRCKGGICSIWYRERNYEGDWAAAKKLPSNINLRKHSAMQPTVGYDRQLRKDVLYFSSDRPGGQGGLDIWGSIIENNYETGDIRFGEPFPLPFNTHKDEVTPFFHMASQTLFFSSNGLPGIGGQDVFSVKKDGAGEWLQPENPGAALNSPSDDWHYIFHTNSRKGYLSSNRSEDGTSDFDIYEVSIFHEIQITTFDIHDGHQLNGVVAEVFDEELGYSTVVREQPFDEVLTLQLAPERSYRIAILVEGYSPQLLIVDTERQMIPTFEEQELHLFKDEIRREVPGQVFPKEQPVHVSRPGMLTSEKEKNGEVVKGLPF